MKEYAATTKGRGLWPSRHFGKDTFGRLCTRMRRGWQKTVKSAKASRKFLLNP